MFWLRLSQKIENKRTRELSEEELTILREEVNKYTTEGDLVRVAQRGGYPTACTCLCQPATSCH